MSKIKNGGLDHYFTEFFEQQQFGSAGIEGVKYLHVVSCCRCIALQELVLTENILTVCIGHSKHLL